MDDDHGKQKKWLEREWSRLTRELEELKAKDVRSSERRESSPFGKRGEEAVHLGEMDRRRAVEKEMKSLLQEVERALKKFEEGTYGFCDQCGQPIDPERLEALPQASQCVKCKAQRSQRR